MAGATTPRSIKKKTKQKKGESKLLFIGDGRPSCAHKHRKEKEKKGTNVSPLLAMASLVAPRSTRKNKKKRKKRGAKFLFCWRQWCAKLPHLYWQWKAQLCLNAFKKPEKRGGAKVPHYLQSSLAHLCPKAQKKKKKNKKEEEWVHAYLGVVDGALATLDVHAQVLSSLGLLLLKIMVQALQAFHSLNIPSFKLSKLTLNCKPKC